MDTKLKNLLKAIETKGKKWGWGDSDIQHEKEHYTAVAELDGFAKAKKDWDQLVKETPGE